MLLIKLEHINKGKAWRHAPLITEMVFDLTHYLYARCCIQTGHYVFLDDSPNFLAIPVLSSIEGIDVVKVIKDSWICSGWEVTVIEGDKI